MKKLLTVVVFNETAQNYDELRYEAAEIISCKEPAEFQRALKKANGKYTVICGNAQINNLQPLLSLTDDANADIIAFDVRAAIKTSAIKGADGTDNADMFLSTVSAAMQCKSVLKSDVAPFTLIKNEVAPCADRCGGILKACLSFKEVKAKLAREVYNFVFENLCAELVNFYACALLEIRGGSYSAEQLTEFDAKIKDEIVLYLALEKRFTAAPLKKLRDKQFKISFITANRLKKLLK
ncbi:MAG: hypothetical protein K2G96_03185 [Clostridia bacterium]|nr:hypothetical protein [Clostridia bacterium]